MPEIIKRLWVDIVVLAVVLGLWAYLQVTRSDLAVATTKLAVTEASAAAVAARFDHFRHAVASSAEAEASAAATEASTAVVYRTITKRVIKYVQTKPASAACSLDAEWLRLHNAAAVGRDPDSSGAVHDSSGAVTTTDALPVVVDNYAAAHRTADRLTGLQNWLRSQGLAK